jgi:arginase
LAQFTIIDAPSILGLRPTGVQHLPEALKAAGLMSELRAEYGGRVSPLSYSSERDKSTLLLNPDSISEFSLRLADAITLVLHKKRFPLVLGGDCSILIGSLLALRRLGTYGLFFIDGHADFYQPQASPTGEVADMYLAIVSGRGPNVLTILKVSNRLSKTMTLLYLVIVMQNNRQVMEAKTSVIPTCMRLTSQT